MLRRFQQSLHQDLCDVRAVRCYVAKLYRVTQVKNTLPWSRHTHSGPHGYQESFAAAKEAAERQRQQGSQSWIREVPSIVVMGANCCVLVATKSPLKPFEEFSDCDFQTSLIGSIAPEAAALGYVFVCDLCPELAEQPFRSFVAKTGDAARPLAWNGKSETRDLNYLQELLGKLQSAIAVEKWMTAANS